MLAVVKGLLVPFNNGVKLVGGYPTILVQAYFIEPVLPTVAQDTAGFLRDRVFEDHSKRPRLLLALDPSIGPLSTVEFHTSFEVL
jgi:hypothetical protein